jgi:hypothetical protein
MTDEPTADLPAVASDDHVAGVGSYETDGGTVLYDADNPLAWIQSSATLAIARMR